MWLIKTTFSAALAAINEVNLCVGYIVDNTIIFIYQLLYILLWVMSSLGSHLLSYCADRKSVV